MSGLSNKQPKTWPLFGLEAWVLDCWITLLMFWQYAEEGKI